RSGAFGPGPGPGGFRWSGPCRGYPVLPPPGTGPRGVILSGTTTIPWATSFLSPRQRGSLFAVAGRERFLLYHAEPVPHWSDRLSPPPGTRGCPDPGRLVQRPGGHALPAPVSPDDPRGRGRVPPPHWREHNGPCPRYRGRPVRAVCRRDWAPPGG